MIPVFCRRHGNMECCLSINVIHIFVMKNTFVCRNAPIHHTDLVGILHRVLGPPSAKTSLDQSGGTVAGNGPDE
jgi:hypothetical protein